MVKPLRVCRVCGLEAWNEKELELFSKNKRRLVGKDTRCKECTNKYCRELRKKHPLKRRYINMVKRCYNLRDSGYSNYGGRGIYVCDEWLNDRETFYIWARTNGFKPKLTIDRIDNDGPYAPWNCRWIPMSQQHRNTRQNVTNWEKGTRICRICKIEKPLSEFHRNNQEKCFGHRYECKGCYAIYRKSLRSKRKIIY